ncbi:GIY-YIG nuclease family protein [Glycomyces sp. YM15]|uniref:GIY-YIG nuclease family protein n=1 Tax=Glycomyces sp. YM15 TaxID=2800446 RepID=UPI0019635DC3|nr:GIY-YIG nuclease family protein [Glycomyces sp. YM15]
MKGKATGEFKLRITKALADQLFETLGELVPTELTADALANLVEPRPGVYLLYLRGDLVYVGKAASNLRARLGNHRRKLSGRSGIEPLDITFKCAYVDEDLDAAAPEKLLLKKYQTDGKIPWNNNGFGNKDQGRVRDQTMIKAGHFDIFFPINLDIQIELEKNDWVLGELLARIASVTPYTFRYEKEKDSDLAREVLSKTTLSVEPSTTVRRAIEAALAAMPAGWQATVLPNTLILYPESKPKIYKSALGWYRSTAAGSAEWTPHRMQVSKLKAQDEVDPDEGLTGGRGHPCCGD